MGTFTAKLKVWNPSQPGRVEELDLWVDTGAAYSWISRERLESLGVRPARRAQFRTIEGRILEREMAPVFVAANGQTGGDTVVMAEPGEMEVLGAFTLESLGLIADVVQKRLVPAGIGLALSAVGQVPTQIYG